MLSEICIHFSSNGDFGEASGTVLRLTRRSEMDQTKHVVAATLPQTVPPRQISMAFESRWLQGLTHSERMRALAHLANLLMLAAGLSIEENSHESR
jgi:hypothetical protein